MTAENRQRICTNKGILVVILGFLAYSCYSFNLNMLNLGMLYMREDLGLTISQGGLLGSSAMLGSVIGPFVFGYLSSKLGNRFGMISSVLVCGIFSVFTALIPHFGTLMIIRFIVGFGTGGIMGPVLAEITKHWSVLWRGRAVAWAMCAYQAGSMFASLTARIVLPDWRKMYYVPIVFGVAVSILIFFFLPKKDEPGIEPEVQETKKQAADIKPKDILVGPVLAVTLLGILVSGMNMAAAYGMGAWIPSWLAEDHGLDPAAMATFSALNFAAGIVGYLVWSYVASKIGTIKTCVIVFLGTAAALVVYAFVSGEGLLVAMGPVTYFFQGGVGCAVSILCSEMYPDRLRAYGSGAAFGAGRIFSVISPFTLALIASSYGYTIAIRVVPIIFALGAVFALLLGAAVKRYRASDYWDGLETK